MVSLARNVASLARTVSKPLPLPPGSMRRIYTTSAKREFDGVGSDGFDYIIVNLHTSLTRFFPKVYK